MPEVGEAIAKAIENASQLGELKGRLQSLETRVQHQETRNDARFDKLELKLEQGFAKLYTEVSAYAGQVSEINLKAAASTGERKGIVTTVVIVASVISGLFGVLQWLLALWMQSGGNLGTH